jgi:hypothetical protein
MAYCFAEPKTFLMPVPYRPDVGHAHVAAWKHLRRLAAYSAASDRVAARVAAEIRAGAFSPFKPANTTPYKPAPRIDDADYLDGDLEMYGTYPAYEWGV